MERAPTPPRPQQIHNAAVQAFRDNGPEKGIGILASAGHIHVHNTPEERIKGIVNDYASRADRAVILSPDKDDRDELTRRIREELRSTGRLSPDAQTISILVKLDLGNSRLATNYMPGDRIQYRTGSPEDHGIPDGSTTVVTGTTPSKNLLMVQRQEGGDTVSYNPALLKKQTAQSTVYRPEEREISSGERIQFTKADPIPRQSSSVPLLPSKR